MSRAPAPANSPLQAACREAMAEALEECSVPDWDGYGADPADPVSAARAEVVLSHLAPKLGVPHCSFDPEGEAVLGWYVASDRNLDMIVGSAGKIYWAARIGRQKENAAEQFADGLPPKLAEVVRRLLAE